MFLGWQISVCVSIAVAGLVSLTALRVVTIGWVVWTLTAVLPVYAPWVGVFQLVNIATTYGVINSKNYSK
jgi:hypothetical protein